MKLIEDWRNAWRFNTMRWWAALITLPEILYRFAITFGDVLPNLSPLITDYLPSEVRSVLAMAGVVSLFLRLRKQDLPPVPPTDQ